MEISQSLKTVLKRLKLSGLLPTLPDRLAYAKKAKLPELDFLDLVLQDEVDRRDQRNLQMRLFRAGFEEDQNLENFDWDAPVTFDRDRVKELFSLGFIERREDMIDWVGAFALTAGVGAEALAARHEKAHDDYASIMVKALADRLGEALAEWLSRKARSEWGYGAGETLTIEELIREKYRGTRPAPGYPACPDHTEKRLLFDLLGAEERVGIRLTETFAMRPAASVCGFYFAHPQSRYFALGKIGKDQVQDYHRRKGMDLRAVERWLAPNLDYDPAD